MINTNRNNIFRLDKSSESEDTAFKRIFSMISPREGWDTYILVLAMVCVAAWIVREAEWVETPGYGSSFSYQLSLV